MLFILAFSNAALLLQSVIEEKSTRMIEVLLCCASPQEIMTGKLFGVIAVALLTLVLWGAGLFAVASFFSHDVVAVVEAGLAAVIGLKLLPLVLLYFFCGLLIYSSIFLGIGAMTNSLPDAQALMTPATLIIVLPISLMGVLIHDPNGMFATVMSWIPIYTPFFMLVRLPFHPPAVELWADGGAGCLDNGLSDPPHGAGLRQSCAHHRTPASLRRARRNSFSGGGAPEKQKGRPQFGTAFEYPLKTGHAYFGSSPSRCMRFLWSLR